MAAELRYRAIMLEREGLSRINVAVAGTFLVFQVSSWSRDKSRPEQCLLVYILTSLLELVLPTDCLPCFLQGLTVPYF